MKLPHYNAYFICAYLYLHACDIQFKTANSYPRLCLWLKKAVYLHHRLPVISSQAIWRPSRVLECPESSKIFLNLLNCPLMIAQLVVIPILRTECLSSAVSGNCLDRALFFCGATADIGFRLLLFFKVSRTHAIQHTHSSARVNSASQRPLPTQQTQETNFHALFRIRTRDPTHRAAADPRLRPHGHRDRQTVLAFNITWRAGV